MRSICLLFLGCIVIHSSLSGTAIIKGNDESNQTTFTFPVHKIVEDSTAYLLYAIAAVHQPDAAKEFAISCIDQTSSLCIPLTPKTVTLNITESNQPNPLYDNAFTNLAVMHVGGESLPVVLTQNNLNQLFMFESTFPGHISILQSAILNDAHLVPTPALQLSLLATDNNGHIFTCTTPVSGIFGDDGSGIAVVVRGFKKENDVQVRAFQQINAITGNAADPAIALPFDRASPFLTFGNNALVSLTPTVLWWDNALQRLYIGISGTGGTTTDDGVRAIAIGRFSGHQLLIEEFVPTSAFDGTNNDLLIGKKGSNQTTNIADIITMHTSGKTAYLIVRGAGNTSTDIQIIPLVQSDDATVHGKVADKNSPSQDIFALGVGDIKIYQKTVTPVPATAPSQLPTLVDPATIPGGGIVLQGIITHMKTVGDTLYVSTSNSSTPELNGMYQTTAIIESSNGRIVGWTEWQPVLLPNTPTSFATINRKTGTLNLLVQDNEGTSNTILQTQWKPATKNNSSLAPLNDFLQIASNGELLQKYIYFPAKTPGITAGSCGMFLYQKSLALSFITHTTADNIQRQTTQTEFTNTQTIFNDTQTITFNANSLFIIKDELDLIGIPTCACVAYATTTNDAWFVVGGTQGVALMSTPTGKGWPLAQGIGDNFVNVPANYTTINTLAIKNILQVTCVNGFLFILTDTQLMRLPLDPTTLLQAPLTTIADIEKGPFGNVQTFTTLLTSGPIALLGSTNGLWTTMPGSTVSTLDNANNWLYILLPESAIAIQELSIITKTGYEGDSTNNQGATIYVYSKDQTAKTGRVNRLYCAPTPNGVAEENTIKVFNDRRLEKIPSHALDLGTNYETVQSNGNSFFSLKNNSGIPIATLSIQAPETTDGHNPYIGLTQWTIPSLLRSPIAGFHTIAGHGSLIIADSQQLYVNQ